MQRWRFNPSKARLLYVAEYGDNCWWCWDGPVQSIDHLIPRGLGGCNHKHNLVGACFTCNNSKGSEFWPEVPQDQWRSLYNCPQVSNDKLRRELEDYWQQQLTLF